MKGGVAGGVKEVRRMFVLSAWDPLVNVSFVFDRLNAREEDRLSLLD